MLLHGAQLQVQIEGLDFRSANFHFHLRGSKPGRARYQLILSIGEAGKLEGSLGIGLPLVQDHQGSEQGHVRLRNRAAAGVEDGSRQRSRLRGGC